MNRTPSVSRLIRQQRSGHGANTRRSPLPVHQQDAAFALASTAPACGPAGSSRRLTWRRRTTRCRRAWRCRRRTTSGRRGRRPGPPPRWARTTGRASRRPQTVARCRWQLRTRRTGPAGYSPAPRRRLQGSLQQQGCAGWPEAGGGAPQAARWHAVQVQGGAAGGQAPGGGGSGSPCWLHGSCGAAQHSLSGGGGGGGGDLGGGVGRGGGRLQTVAGRQAVSTAWACCNAPLLHCPSMHSGCAHARPCRFCHAL